MHDPDVVLFDATPLLVVWHREPGGHDSGEVCRDRGRSRWHVHHWRLQHPWLQALRRRLLTRCAWCGGPSRPGDVVNFATGWDTESRPWWRGEAGLLHSDCSGVRTAHVTCTCRDPLFDHDGYGWCALCGRSRGWGARRARLDMLAALRERVPAGQRRPPEERP